GRDVFAVPGSPLDPRCRGSNDLLRRGAILTEGAEDVLSHLQPQLTKPASPRSPPPSVASAARRAVLTPAAPQTDDALLDLVLEKLGRTPVAVDELVRQCHLSAAAMATLLLELELAGRVERHPGNLVSLR